MSITNVVKNELRRDGIHAMMEMAYANKDDPIRLERSTLGVWEWHVPGIARVSNPTRKQKLRLART
jgi:hypothetical protein